MQELLKIRTHVREDIISSIQPMGVFEGIANVIACAPSEILVLSSEFLERFLRKSPTIAAKVLLNLSRMLAGNLAKCN